MRYLGLFKVFYSTIMALNPIEYQSIAEETGLRYVSDSKPGITRKKHGNGFYYFDNNGARIKDDKIITRIQSIGIPPAYQDVWICPQANGHIQATGKDAKGRKQYRYHPKWRSTRDQDKFDHMLEFGDMLPQIRKKIDADLKLKGLPREKVLACVVNLLEKTLIRVGNNEYARDNNSFGLTTLRRKHIHVSGHKIKFEFTGKSGKNWNLSVNDRRIAAIVNKCADIPGYELFKYICDDGTKKDVTSADVNAYLKEITGQNFTAKDFRTWSGTVLATLALTEFEKYDSEAQAKKNVVRAVEHVAKQLGNTPAICRKCYIHPEVIQSYLSGDLATMIGQEIDATMKENYTHFVEEEIMVLAFLKNRLRALSKA
jgi:DNA topoisomerase I